MIILIVSGGVMRQIHKTQESTTRVGFTATQVSRRAAQRTRIFKGARVQAPGSVPLRCVVRDISLTGARIDRPGPIAADFFRLSFDDPNWPQEVACEVVWRADEVVGVHFF